ncbi:hypothetical protein BC936DRAFT_136759 [Jimgerdemannia flammicorona]|uniref:Uncharacterized protein n=1 Tax=Jimgerdemannia flammicorona TaxID=994334 RepID=A0A433CYW8_9FUNG|nr:hypothetical protein BC936DRAFT_136759 [Jimgerdemannia flammicorona]
MMVAGKDCTTRLRPCTACMMCKTTRTLSLCRCKVCKGSGGGGMGEFGMEWSYGVGRLPFQRAWNSSKPSIHYAARKLTKITPLWKLFFIGPRYNQRRRYYKISKSSLLTTVRFPFPSPSQLLSPKSRAYNPPIHTILWKRYMSDSNTIIETLNPSSKCLCQGQVAQIRSHRVPFY